MSRSNALLRLSGFACILAGCAATTDPSPADAPLANTQARVLAVDRSAGTLSLEVLAGTDVESAPVVIASRLEQGALLQRLTAGERVLLRVALIGGQYQVLSLKPAP